MSWYLAALSKYAQFDGRSRRMEYWMFTLINVVVMVVLSLIGGVGAMMGTRGLYTAPSLSIGFVLYCLYALFTFIPSLAVTVRRLHDTGRSGWWFLIALIPFIGTIVLLVFMFLDGTPGENQYGPNPKGFGV